MPLEPEINDLLNGFLSNHNCDFLYLNAENPAFSCRYPFIPISAYTLQTHKSGSQGYMSHI
jgi:hypothetical protein